MKIPSKFPQFDTHRSLFVVTGSVEADFYIAFEGEINNVGNFTIPKPVYSDREGSSRGGSSGRAMEKGAVIEKIKTAMHKDFINQLKNSLKELAKDKIDHLYLFCPAAIHNDVEGTLTAPLKKKLVHTWKGNYQHEKPTALLEKIGKI